MLDGLGEEGVVDALLKELASPKTTPARRAHIGTELAEERLVHQGNWSEAALAAVPKLLALVEKVPDPVLMILAHVAAGVPQAYWGGESTAALTKMPTYVAVLSGRAKIEALLASRSKNVRTWAALVLALLPPGTIGDRFTKEKDPLARFALYLCLAAWKAQVPNATETDPLVRFARAFALTDVAALKAAVLSPPPKPKYLGLSPQRMALARLPPDALKAFAMEALDAGALTADHAACLIMGDRRAGREWASLPPFAELNERAALKALAKHVKATDYYWHPRGCETGLPQSGPDLHRYIAGDETFVPLRRFALGEITRTELVTMSARDPAAFATAISEWRYDLDDVMWSEPWTLFTDIACQILLLHPDAIAKMRPSEHALAALATLDAMVQTGKPIPAAWDEKLKTLDRYRPPDDERVERVLRALSGERRDAALFTFALPLEIEEGERAGRRILPRHEFGWRYLTLAHDRKKALARAKEAVVGQKKIPQHAARVLGALE